MLNYHTNVKKVYRVFNHNDTSINASEPDLREVSTLSSLNCILGNVVSEYHTWVAAVHHAHSLLLHGLHITLALQLSSQTLPAAVITQIAQSQELQ